MDYNADRDYQGNFVRFVYCLANGERDLVPIASNKGTWQFWKILFSCVNEVSGTGDFSPILKGTTQGFDTRMRNKIHLLQDLKEAGIWLLDASIAGINGLDWQTKTRVMEQCWQSYIGPVITSLSPRPKLVVVIGAGVERILGSKLQHLSLDNRMIPQPQARLEGGYFEYYRKCFDFCSKARANGE